MLGGSEEKIMCHTSARFHVIITWTLTDTRRSKNIQKKVKFDWKIRIQHRLDKQDSYKKKWVPMKKLSKLFWNTCLYLCNM